MWRRVRSRVKPLPGQTGEPTEDTRMPDLSASSPGSTEKQSPRGSTVRPASRSAEKPDKDRLGLADRGKEKRIRRGRTPVDQRIDLHGYTQDQAKSALFQFILAARGDGERSILVITGKGRNGPGVLRIRLLDWLSHGDFRPHVSGYAQAHQKHGGDGAFYLFLRAPDPKAPFGLS